MALEASKTDDELPAPEHVIIADEPNKFAESLFRGGGKGSIRSGGGGITTLTLPNSKHTNNTNTTDHFSFTPSDKPTPTEIRRWMLESQISVDKVVTHWQSTLINQSQAVSRILEELARFVSNLDNKSASSASKSSFSSSMLTSKLQNNTGTFESTMKVYLHVILIAVKKVVQVISKTNSRNRKDMLTAEERHRFVSVMTHFTFVAEDALKFLHMHEKYLAPACSEIISMRNNLYKILRTVNTEPLGKIIPILSTVPLEEVRMKEDSAWMKKHSKQDKNYFAFLEVKVGARNYSFLVPPKPEGSKEHSASNKKGGKEETTLEGLELIEILLNQLRTCIQSSTKSCKECQHQLSQIGSQLWKHFYTLLATLKMERRRERLKPENCSESLKYSLCNLEVQFHQVEKLLEEIPDHLRRIVGICDECCMQLITGFGDAFYEVFQEEWSSSPVKDIAEEYFKTRRSFFQGCFPFLWRVLVKVFLGLSGSSGNHKTGETDKKLKEFWELVKTEMEDFQKELKAKELESDYRIVLTVPISSTEGDSDRRQEVDLNPDLPKYLLQYLQYKISNDELNNDGG